MCARGAGPNSASDHDRNRPDLRHAFMVPLPQLPPLPAPRPLQFAQRVRSVAIVFGSAIGGLLFVHGLNFLDRSEGNTAYSIVLVLAWTHTTIALLGLIAIQMMDPGTIRRCEKTCLPLPPVVAERLEARQPLDGLRNLVDAGRNASYCVRCCVWRPLGSHHCSICQRCVGEHDHHCTIFGRCVGGSTRGCRGNLLVFKINIGNLAATPLTCGLAFVVAMSEHLGGLWGALFVLCPASALCLGHLRRNWDDIAALFMGHARLRRDAAPSQRLRVVAPSIDAEEALANAIELNDAARMALEQEAAQDDVDDEDAEGCVLSRREPMEGT